MKQNRDEKKTSNCDCLANATRGWVIFAGEGAILSSRPYWHHARFCWQNKKKRHMRTKSRKLPMLVKLARFIFSLIGDLYIPLAIPLSNGLALVSRLEVVQDSK